MDISRHTSGSHEWGCLSEYIEKRGGYVTFARECVRPQNLRSLPFPNTMIYCSVTSCKYMHCQKMSHDSTIIVYTGVDVNDGPSSDWGYHHVQWYHRGTRRGITRRIRLCHRLQPEHERLPTEATCWMVIVSVSSCVMTISTLRETAPWLISTGIGSLPVTMSFPFSTF